MMMKMSKGIIYSNNKGLSLKELALEDKEAFDDLLCEETELMKCDDIRDYYYETLHKVICFYMLSDEGIDRFIGYICITPHEDEAPEIGIYLSPDYRGKGIAIEFLPKAMEYYSKMNDVPFFIYKTRANNIASQKVAKALGAIKMEDEGNNLHERLIALSEELKPEIREEFLSEFVKDYNPESEKVIRFRIDIKT